MAPGLKLARFRHSLSCGYEALFFTFILLYNESELFAREPLFSSADLFFDDILCRADIKYLYVTQFNYKLELHSCTLMFTSI